ncbi:MAG TPA: prepilin-type N-terminal cleavage/methylation domain-containing protein [Acidobacteriota bacterium]|jgi:prepilin-type N-terminal cleavage/methylation domain-containing protein
MTDRRGFTLIELVISLALIGVLSLIIFTALQVSLKIYRTGQERMDYSQREKVVIGLVKTQIGSTYPVRPQGKFYEPIRQQQQQQQGVAPPGTPDSFFERLVNARLRIPPLFKGEPRRILFASFAPLFFRKNAGMSMISYSFDRGEQGALEFVETEEQYRGGQTYLEMTVGDKVKGTVFFKNLEDGTFEYFGAKEPDEYFWHTSWDAETVGKLPLAVRITMLKKDQKKLRIVGLINADGTTGGPGFGAGGVIPPNLRGIIGGGAQ